MGKVADKNAQINELKIELYPKKKPRYDFHRESLKCFVTKDTLGFSFDEKDKLAFVGT